MRDSILTAATIHGTGLLLLHSAILSELPSLQLLLQVEIDGNQTIFSLC